MSYDIAYKSCIFDGEYFSNTKIVPMDIGIDYLKQKCALIDKINDTFDIHIYELSINKFIDFPHVTVHSRYLYIKMNYMNHKFINYIKFNSYEEFYDHVYKHYPHLIKNRDIKIALKD